MFVHNCREHPSTFPEDRTTRSSLLLLLSFSHPGKKEEVGKWSKYFIVYGAQGSGDGNAKKKFIVRSPSFEVFRADIYTRALGSVDFGG
ncbi:hypothetical protein CEXT_562091 [Caerostris extrusa]|uniref:Uncharacterized protein n=1 Tax=Caerostris extrusa TaxID=172846 RepID=A0AAV4XVD0_CAEEX|nr:hypothetical protein CEXT_562091 [Caerostris extrusa]